MTSRIEKLHLSKTDNGYLELDITEVVTVDLQWGQEKDFTRLYSRSFQTPLNNLKQSFGKIGQKGENYDPTVEFKENCFDFHIGLETWFKVTAHPYPTSLFMWNISQK